MASIIVALPTWAVERPRTESADIAVKSAQMDAALVRLELEIDAAGQGRR